MRQARPVDGLYAAEYVAQRLAEAGEVLRALPATGTRPAGYRAFWPAMPDDIADGGFASPPPARRVSEMEQAFSWLALIPDGPLALRRLVADRTLARMHPETGEMEPLLSWRRLGEARGISDFTAKRRWERGIDAIVLRLNRPGLCALLGGPTRDVVGRGIAGGIPSRRRPLVDT